MYSDKISGETLFLNGARVVGTSTLSCDSSEVCRSCDETEDVSLAELGWSTWSSMMREVLLVGASYSRHKRS